MNRFSGLPSDHVTLRHLSILAQVIVIGSIKLAFTAPEPPSLTVNIFISHGNNPSLTHDRAPTIQPRSLSPLSESAPPQAISSQDWLPWCCSTFICYFLGLRLRVIWHSPLALTSQGFFDHKGAPTFSDLYHTLKQLPTVENRGPVHLLQIFHSTYST